MPGKNPQLLQDANLTVATSLPAGGNTATSTLITLGNGPLGNFDPQRLTFQLQAPLLSTTQLPNSTYTQYQIYTTDAGTTNAASAQLMCTVPANGDANINNTSNETFALGSASGSSAFTYTFKLSTLARNQLFATATLPTSTLATTATFTLTALV